MSWRDFFIGFFTSAPVWVMAGIIIVALLRANGRDDNE